MKVVIADDEQLVRYSLRSMIDELALPLAVCAEATNGSELMQTLITHHPDIAIVDIKMPGMSGLDAMAETLTKFSDIGWIVLTGYSEFAYAKRAIELGAADYLMKPAAPEELSRVLTTLIDTRARAYLSRSTEYEYRLSAILRGAAHISAAGDERGYCHAGALLVLDTSRDKTAAQKLRLDLTDMLRSRACQFSGRARRAAVATGNGAEVTVVFAWEKCDTDGESIALHTAGVIGTLALSRSTRDAVVTIVTTPAAPTLDDWLGLLKKAKDGATGRPMAGVDCVHGVEQLHRGVTAMPPAVARLSNIAVQLSSAFAARDSLSYLQRVEELENLLRSAESALETVDLAPIIRFLNVTVGYPTGEYELQSADEPPRPFFIDTAKLRSRAGSMPPDESGGRSAALADQIAEFVESNYMNNLSVVEMSRHFGVTPNYLSTLFRRARGETFVRFVTRIRMEHASELLLDRRLKIQQVARLVGYANPRHFTRIFHGHFGRTPFEHQKRARSEGSVSES